MNREQHLVPSHGSTPEAVTDVESRAMLRHLHTLLSGQPLQIGPVHMALQPVSATHPIGSELTVRWRAMEVVLGPGEHSRIPQVRIGGLDTSSHAPAAVPTVR